MRTSTTLRRLGMAAQNALEIVRAGRLSAPQGAPFQIADAGEHHKLRRYLGRDGRPVAGPALVLVPPLMVAADVYDIAPDISAVTALAGGGVDPWLVDFGAPEREAGGMQRTLDDHVRAVDAAVEVACRETGRDVHLAGYSQGGMFVYQVAAYRRSRSLASLITFGSPVDVHRNVPNVPDDLVERAAAVLRAVIALPLARIEGLPGRVSSTGFKLVSARKEIAQLVDFVRKLHDRQALERRESRRLFLAGEGFVAWPGPALRKFIDDIVVGNRMLSGGFVIDGRTISLADIRCPILYFVGLRDEIARPAAVRSIERAAPHAEAHEVAVRAGHFGLVVGSTAIAHTWPCVIEWVRWRDGMGGKPAALEPRSAEQARPGGPGAPGAPGGGGPGRDSDGDTDDRDRAGDSERGGDSDDLRLIVDVARGAGRTLLGRLGQVTRELADVAASLRAQVPRLRRLRSLSPGDAISASRELAGKARTSPDQTFFLWQGRAFSYGDANRRVDNVVRGLIACGIRPGQRVGVLMNGRPSYLSIVTALNRLGAVSVLISPATREADLPGVLALGEVTALVTDPDNAARGQAAGRDVLVLGARRTRPLPEGAVNMEAIDPDAVALPAWYEPDPGRAGDLAMVIFGAGRGGEPRASRITNQRWAFAALGAAAACTLTARDTVYCCLPLHHAAGILVSAGGALASGARLALADGFEPRAFWPEVRRYGATVVFYAGEMCRFLVDAPAAPADRLHPVRLFAGSGMRADVWRRVVDRFGAGVLEFYATTEGNAVLANASGEKVGALGRPLPGSAELAVVRCEVASRALVRGPDGRLSRCADDERGVLLARIDAAHPLGTGAGAEAGAGAGTRAIARDAFAPGDAWLVTGDVVRRDAGGDYWFVDRLTDMIWTHEGAVATTQIEDALYDIRTVALAVAYGVPASAGGAGEDGAPAGAGDAAVQLPAAVVVPREGHAIAPGDVERACARLPEHARPRFVRIAATVPMTDGYRPIKAPLRRAGPPAPGDPDVLRYDPATGRYERASA